MTREELRELVSISEALDLLEIPGPNKIPGHINCLFHDENTPSLAIYEDHWHAFCCGIGGDVVNLVMRALGCTYPQAARFLSGYADDVDRGEVRVQRAEKILLDLTEQFERESQDLGLTLRDDVTSLLHHKWPHLHQARLQDWGIRASDYNLLVPHRDAEGIVRGVKTRSLLPARLGTKNAFKGSTFTSRLYRVLDRSDARVVWLTEGESDTWTLSQHFVNVPTVAVYGLPSGASTWRDEWADELLSHGGIIYVVFDNDNAGVAARKRVVDAINKKAGRLMAWAYEVAPPANDVSEAYFGGWRPTS